MFARRGVLSSSNNFSSSEWSGVMWCDGSSEFVESFERFLLLASSYKAWDHPREKDAVGKKDLLVTRVKTNRTERAYFISNNDRIMCVWMCLWFMHGDWTNTRKFVRKESKYLCEVERKKSEKIGERWTIKTSSTALRASERASLDVENFQNKNKSLTYR